MNPILIGVHLRSYILAAAAGVFKYVWPFSGQQEPKG